MTCKTCLGQRTLNFPDQLVCDPTVQLPTDTDLLKKVPRLLRYPTHCPTTLSAIDQHQPTQLTSAVLLTSFSTGCLTDTRNAKKRIKLTSG